VAVATTSRKPIGNYLLDALPGEELEELLPYVEYVELPSGKILHVRADSITHVYFPLDAVVSLISTTDNGATAEAATVSREGMVGLPVFLGSDTTSNQAVVLIAGSSIRIKAQTFREEFCKSRLLRSLLRRYTHTLLTQTSQTAACNYLHLVGERFARWLLLLQDCLGNNEFKLTHEIIGEMLGARRERVTGAALRLQQRGLIRYKHGRIQIVDRKKLEAAACECYGIIRTEFDQLHIAILTEKVAIAKDANRHTLEHRREMEKYEASLEALRDINRRLLKAAVREHKARAEAEEANHAKDEFLATVSHELRTPLTAMIGWSHMLRVNKPDKAMVTHALEVIERNGQMQAQLIEDMLDISRIVAGKLRLDFRSVSLNSIVEAAIEAWRPMADSKGVRLQSGLDSKESLITGDPSRLEQVFGNLLSNAIKFTPADGLVEVVSRRATKNHVEVTMSDTGRGISTEFMPHIFDRFRQADWIPTREYGGLGLGLAITRHLVESHGGSINAESRGEGQGATFRVLFPLSHG
jgi:signal transduction histidine kinase